MKKNVLSILTICILMMSMSVFAHSGRTDGSGGHRDNKNTSGLGGYHYHCGGYPPHLHSGGICPYKGSSSNSSSSYQNESKTVYATSITINNVPENLNAGETVKLNASVYPSNAEDDTIYWESSDTRIASVSNTGNLTAVGIGTAVITAKTSQGTSKKFTLTVNEVIAERISIATNYKQITIGSSQQLKCIFTPENTTDKTLGWASSDNSIISITSNGKITANKIGTATITATHKELADSINIEVTPIDAKSVEIILPNDIETTDEGYPVIKKGVQIQLKGEIEPADTTYKEIEWSVSNEDIASIDENGVLATHSAGIVIVTATTKSGATEEVEIKVQSNSAIIILGLLFFLIIAFYVVYYINEKRKSEE